MYQQLMRIFLRGQVQMGANLCRDWWGWRGICVPVCMQALYYTAVMSVQWSLNWLNLHCTPCSEKGPHTFSWIFTIKVFQFIWFLPECFLW